MWGESLCIHSLSLLFSPSLSLSILFTRLVLNLSCTHTVSGRCDKVRELGSCEAERITLGQQGGSQLKVSQ